jgi:hypothetical protein
MDYIGDCKYTTCGHVAGMAIQQGYAEPCLLQFSTIYAGRKSRDDLRVDLNKAAKKQGFQFTVCKSKHTAQATVWKTSCTCHRMVEDKACKRKYVKNEAQYTAGTKVTTMKENHLVEQRGPTGIDQPRKTERSLPTLKNNVCPFKINIHFNKKVDLFYLLKTDQYTPTVIMAGVLLYLLELTNSTRMWRK